jgi:hypothetical protein
MAMKIVVGIVVVIAGFLTYVAFQPSDYKITRRVTIHAPAELIFPHLNNGAKSDEWSPWKEVDPKAQMVRSGPEEGVGSKQSWESEGPLGTGSATVVESIPSQKVTVLLEYAKPMAMTQTAEFNILPAATGTVVEWSVTGKNNFMGRLFCVFMDMDKMVGETFEKGLAKLKANVEGGAQPAG